MFGIQDISVDFLTGTPVWVWVGLLVLAGLAWLLYRRTNPPLPGYRRILMGAIRLIAVLSLMAALSEPVVHYRRQYERPRRVAVVRDRSASMERVESGRTRQDRVDSLLADRAMARLASACDLTVYSFGGNLVRNPSDVLSQETALGTILNELDRSRLAEPDDSWLLFTDGRSNSGPNPVDIARSLRTPITSVGMAAAGEDLDIAVAEVDYNPVVFVGQPTEVEVKLQWHRAEGRTVQVRLLDSGQVLTESRVTLDQESGFADIKLSYVPTLPGQRLLIIEAPPLANETETDNNARTVSVKAMRSRVSILLATSGPDYEVGFLNRFLRRSERYEIELVSIGSRSGNLAGRIPLEQSELNRYDLVILHDPDPDRLNAYRDQLRSYLSERGGGLWLLMAEKFAARATPSWLVDLLPFNPGGQVQVVYTSFHGVPAEGQLFHPAVRLADSRAAIRETWADLPPFKSLVPCLQTAAAGVVLAYTGRLAEVPERVPILGYRRVGPGKVLASTALPYWPWGFETVGYSVDNSAYAALMEGAVNWLTVQDDFDPIRIAPEKDVFSRSEPIRFKGFAFDQGFRPIPGVFGTVTLTGVSGDDKFEADLQDRGDGEHVGEFKSVPPGEYTYEASFTKDDQVLRTSRGRLLIESFSLEEYDQRGDPVLLAALSRATGGSYFDFGNFADAIASIDPTPVTETINREITVWGKLWLLWIFVGALALEWVLRKLNHLL